MQRCFWCSDDPVYQAYHDYEWGVPLREPKALFELLLLEGFQAGLSWITVLKKREHYRKVLFGFAAEKIAALSDEQLESLLQDPGIIRNRAKLKAARANAQAWLRLDDPVTLLWSFVGGQPLINHFAEHAQIPSQTEQSQAMSKALRKLGFNFVGPTICYAFMQASGMVMDHTFDCWRYPALSRSGTQA